jgi:hypothetical protein
VVPRRSPPKFEPADTRDYHDKLPSAVREHLACRVVDELEPIEQRHTFEGLVMGAP